MKSVKEDFGYDNEENDFDNLDFNEESEDTEGEVEDLMLPTALSQLVKDCEAFDRLTLEEEYVLVRQYQKFKDKLALTKLIGSNIKRIIQMTAKYCSGQMELEDAVQNAIGGFMLGCEKFDCSRGTRLFTYCSYYIHSKVNRTAPKEGFSSIVVPAHAQESIFKIRKAIGRLDSANRPITNESIAELTGLKADKIAWLRKEYPSISSLDDTMNDKGDDSGKSMADYIAAEDADGLEVVLSKELSEEIEKALCGLNRGQRDIVERHFGLSGYAPTTFAQIAKDRSESRQSVQRKFDSAIENLRGQRGKALARYLSIGNISNEEKAKEVVTELVNEAFDFPPVKTDSELKSDYIDERDVTAALMKSSEALSGTQMMAVHLYFGIGKFHQRYSEKTIAKVIKIDESEVSDFIANAIDECAKREPIIKEYLYPEDEG